MKYNDIINLIFTFTLLVSIPAYADIAVIVHPSNTSNLTQKEVVRIFMGKEKIFPNGTEIIILYLVKESPTRSIFLKNVLNKNESQIQSYWMKKLFTGKGTPPTELNTDEEVVELVANNPSVIGYINASALNDSVRVAYQP